MYSVHKQNGNEVIKKEGTEPLPLSWSVLLSVKRQVFGAGPRTPLELSALQIQSLKKKRNQPREQQKEISTWPQARPPDRANWNPSACRPARKTRLFGGMEVPPVSSCQCQKLKRNNKGRQTERKWKISNQRRPVERLKSKSKAREALELFCNRPELESSSNRRHYPFVLRPCAPAPGFLLTCSS